MIKNIPSHFGKQNIGRIVCVALVYFGVAQSGLWLASDNDNVTTLLSASGIALGAVLLYGKRIASGILLGSFIYNLLLFRADVNANQYIIILSAFLTSIGCVLQALLGNYLFTKLVPDKNPFDKATEVYRFSFITIIICHQGDARA